MLPLRVGLILLFSALVCLDPSFAAEKEKEIEIEAGTVVSNYVWRGIRLSEGPAYQSSVTAVYRGLSVNFWDNFDFETHMFNEADLTVCYSRAVKRFTLGAGFIHTGLVDLHDSDEFFLSASADYPLHPSIQAYFDINAGRGAYLRGSAGHTFEISPRVSFDLTAAMGIIFQNSFMGLPDSGREFTGLYNAEILAAFPIQLNRGWTLKLHAAASTPLSRNARQAIVNSSVCEPGQRFCNGTIAYGGATFLYNF